MEITKDKRLQALQQRCVTELKDDIFLEMSATQVVFGKGNPNAKIVFVGEAPGNTEDDTGIPFVGVSGKLLNNHLKAIGLSLNDIYICNVLKLRPPKKPRSSSRRNRAT